MRRRLLTAACAAMLGAGAGCGFGPPLTPLIGAAREGDTARIAALVRAGADPNQRGGVNSWTPLMHAIHKNQPGAVRTLISGGADVNATYGDGETPLMMAAGYGQTEIVRMLLDAGANPYARNAHSGTALDLAVGGTTDIDDFTAGSCQTPTVRLLLERAPELRLSGKLARTAARVGGCREVLALVDRKADPAAAAPAAAPPSH